MFESEETASGTSLLDSFSLKMPSRKCSGEGENLARPRQRLLSQYLLKVVSRLGEGARLHQTGPALEVFDNLLL